MESEPVGISGGGIDPEDRRGTKLTRATTAPRLKGLGAASDASDATDPEMPDLIEASPGQRWGRIVGRWLEP